MMDLKEDAKKIGETTIDPYSKEPVVTDDWLTTDNHVNAELYRIAFSDQARADADSSHDWNHLWLNLIGTGFMMYCLIGQFIIPMIHHIQISH